MTRATVDGVEGTFVVDTGASFVTLGRAFAVRVGVRSTGPRVLLATASGQVTGTSAGGLGAGPGRDGLGRVVVVVDELPAGLDGLLGLSWLARFDLVTTEPDLEIRPR